jgi:uncharacterized glyoxalase superfamily protein PhnB
LHFTHSRAWPKTPRCLRSVLGFRGFTLAHNVKTKEDADKVFAQAVAAGATAVKTPQSVFWGGYSGYFADPDGFLWEVAFNPFTDLT